MCQAILKNELVQPEAQLGPTWLMTWYDLGTLLRPGAWEKSLLGKVWSKKVCSVEQDMIFYSASSVYTE